MYSVWMPQWMFVVKMVFQPERCALLEMVGVALVQRCIVNTIEIFW
jgi:hypothetical protein